MGGPTTGGREVGLLRDIVTTFGGYLMFMSGVMTGCLMGKLYEIWGQRNPSLEGLSMKQLILKRLANVSSLRVIYLTATHKMVFVVRTDLGMGKGKIAAQCSHAAVNCFELAMIQDPNSLDLWDARGRKKICLKASGGESSLIALQEKADEMGIVSALIEDAGHTQVEPGTVTVLGIGPALNEDIDKITSHLKLL